MSITTHRVCENILRSTATTNPSCQHQYDGCHTSASKHSGTTVPCKAASLITAVLMLTLTVTLSGCSDASGYSVPSALTEVSGAVTLDDQPIANVNINFLPIGKTAGKGGFAVANESGQFQAQDYSMAYGLEPGIYNVTFSRLLTPDGSPLPAGQDAADVGAVESLPPHLVTPMAEPHPYKVTVSADSQSIDFALTSRQQRRR